MAAQVPATAELAAAAPTQVVIQPGNNLWKLSRQIYGKGIMYTVIYEANKDQIRRPESDLSRPDFPYAGSCRSYDGSVKGR